MQVPEGWKLDTLKNIVSQDRKITYGIVVPGPETQNGNYMIRAQDYSKGWVDIDTIYRVSWEVDSSYKRSKVKTNDVLLTIVGSIGNLAVVPATLNGANLTQQTARLDFEKYNYYFYFSMLASDIGRREIYRYAKSGVQPSLNLGDVEKFILPVPPLQEQQKIAQILSTWDQAITTTEQLLTNSQQQKKALMQQLLTGKKRLLDNNGQRFSGEWEKKFVKEIGRVITGNTPPKSEADNYGGNILWATAEDFTDKYIFNTAQRLTEKGAEEAKVLPKGSVLVTCIASIGKNAIAADAMGTNQQINAVLVNHAYSNEFFYYQICFNKNKLLALAGVTAVPIVNKGAFEKIKLSMPSLEEQQKIAAVLSVADKEITTLEQKINQLKQEKKALMQQLLTGKRRVQLKEATE